MHTGQKVLLAVLQAAGRPLSATELVQWVFAFSREHAATSYDFLPLAVGPESFALRRDVDKLLEGKCLATAGGGLTINTPANVPDELKRRALSTVRRLRELSKAELSEAMGEIAFAALPTRELRVYTCGYEGVSIDGFLNQLLRAGVRRLVDVRRNPIARRYGFHKSTLGTLCGRLGIEYRHLPELGIASELRHGDRAVASRQELLDWYESEYLPEVTEPIRVVAEWMTKSPSAVMCQEANPCECHRSRLARSVARLTALPVYHLRQST